MAAKPGETACQECSKSVQKNENVTDPTITVACKHGRDHSHVIDKKFEIVPDDASSQEERITITWKGPNAPNEVSFGKYGKIKGNPYQLNYGKFKFNNDTIQKTLLTLLKNCFPYFSKEDISINIPGRSSVDVTIYNPTTWAIEMEFPISKGKTEKGGYEWNKELKSGKEKDHYSKEKSKTSKKEPFFDIKKISVKKNGVGWDLDLFSIVNDALIIYLKIEDFKNLLKDLPKVGWYYDWELKFMQGNLKLNYGWKEYTDHRSYFELVGSGSITLIEWKGEVGFGISGFSFKIQAFMELSTSVPITLKAENTKPISDLGGIKIILEVKPQGEFKVGARFEAAYFIKIELTLKTGIEASGKGVISFENGLSTDIKIEFTGVTANLEGSVGTGGANGKKNKGNGGINETVAEISKNSSSKNSKPIVLIPSHTIWEGHWPAEVFIKKETECTKSEFSRILEATLNGEYFKDIPLNEEKINIMRNATQVEIEEKRASFFRLNKNSDYYTPLSNTIIASDLAIEIFQDEFVSKTKKNIEGMALIIRKDLEIITLFREEFDIGKYSMFESDFNKYKQERLPEIISNNSDLILIAAKELNRKI
jgi:hypothetical protein